MLKQGKDRISSYSKELGRREISREESLIKGMVLVEKKQRYSRGGGPNRGWKDELSGRRELVHQSDGSAGREDRRTTRQKL